MKLPIIARRRDIILAVVIVAACTVCAAVDVYQDFDLDAWYVIAVIGLMFVRIAFCFYFVLDTSPL